MRFKLHRGGAARLGGSVRTNSKHRRTHAGSAWCRPFNPWEDYHEEICCHRRSRARLRSASPLRCRRRPPTSTACLITKTDTNPFFVKMKEGATAKAKELGVDAEVLCRQDRWRPRKPGCRDRNLHRRRRQGYPDHRFRHQGHRPTGQEGRDAGLLVIALDTPLDPADCCRRDLRDRQPARRQADRPVGRRNAGRQGQGRQDRLPRPDARRSRPSTFCATRAS